MKPISHVYPKFVHFTPHPYATLNPLYHKSTLINRKNKPSLLERFHQLITLSKTVVLVDAGNDDCNDNDFDD